MSFTYKCKCTFIDCYILCLLTNFHFHKIQIHCHLICTHFFDVREQSMNLIREVLQGMFSLQSVTDLSATDRSPASLLPFPVYLAAVISQAFFKDNH